VRISDYDFDFLAPLPFPKIITKCESLILIQKIRKQRRFLQVAELGYKKLIVDEILWGDAAESPTRGHRYRQVFIYDYQLQSEIGT